MLKFPTKQKETKESSSQTCSFGDLRFEFYSTKVPRLTQRFYSSCLHRQHPFAGLQIVSCLVQWDPGKTWPTSWHGRLLSGPGAWPSPLQTRRLRNNTNWYPSVSNGSDLKGSSSWAPLMPTRGGRKTRPRSHKGRKWRAPRNGTGEATVPAYLTLPGGTKSLPCCTDFSRVHAKGAFSNV